MPVFCLRTVQSPKKGTRGVYHLSRPQHFRPHPGGGGWVAVGGGGKAAIQGKSPFTAKIRPFICRLSASQTSEHFLPEIKNVGF
jgi:hypothetical protein